MSWFDDAKQQWDETHRELELIAEDFDAIVMAALHEAPVTLLGRERVSARRIVPNHQQNGHVIVWSVKAAGIETADVEVSARVKPGEAQNYSLVARIATHNGQAQESISGESTTKAFDSYTLEGVIEEALHEATLAYLDDECSR